MPMNQVRGVYEFDAARFQLAMSRGYVLDTQVKSGLRAGSLRLFGQHEPRTAAIEKRELSECVEMRNFEYTGVPVLSFFDISD